MMRKIACCAVAAAALLVCAGCKKKAGASGMTVRDGVLSIGMEIGYPPFEYYAEDGKTPAGFDVQLGAEIAARLGLKAEYVDVAWDGILAGVDTGKYDCIMSAMTITPERLANYDFSKPYIGNGQSVVITKDSALSVKSPEDLTGLRVGYQAETTSDIFMTKQAAAGLVFTEAEYDKVLNAFEDLRLGRCDAVCADALVSVDYINKPNSPYVIVWQGAAEEFFGVCVKKGSAELLAAIDKALDDMFADGTMIRISEGIFGADMVSFVRQ